MPRLVRAAAPIALACLVLLASCTNPVDWSDYDGVNMIAGTTLTDWYLAPGLTSGTTNPDTGEVAPTNFVVFEQVTETSVTGTLPAGADGPVYRLEVPNLLENGDFEATTAGSTPGQWTEVESLATDVNAVVTTANALEGNKGLRLVKSEPTARFYTDLASPAGLADGFPQLTNLPQYAVSFLFQSDETTERISLTSDSATSTQVFFQFDRSVQNSSTVFDYPGMFDSENQAGDGSSPNLLVRTTDVSTATRFSFGGDLFDSQSVIAGVTLDRLVIVRSSQSHYVRLPVTWRADGRPDVASGGTYTLTLWVRPDPTAGAGAARENGRVAARAIAAGIDITTRGDTTTVPTATPASSPSVAVRLNVGSPEVASQSDWTQLTFNLSGREIDPPGGLALDTVAFDLVLEIGNSTEDPGHDAGSLLIMDPELSWSPQTL